MNTMEFKQAATYLQGIQNQVTGKNNLAAANTGEFTSIATTLLQTGVEPAYNALSNMITRTVLSVRPYNEKFQGVEMTESAFGQHVRKIQFADKDIINDERFLYPMAYDSGESPANGDGRSVDMFKIRKADPLQTNFYGQFVYADRLTFFRDQLRGAFEGPEQLNAYISGMTLEMSNNGGILDEASTDRVINVLTKYNEETGGSFTATTIKQADNWGPFVKWLAGYILTLSTFMEQRSSMFQTIVNNKYVNRHTPRSEQRFYMLSSIQNDITTRVLADTYHDELVNFGDFEAVPFWQSIKDPDAINVIPSRIGSDGAQTTPESAVSMQNVLGFICDREAFGTARVDSWAATTQFNTAGAYWNTDYKETIRTYNDHTEKGVVLLLA